MTEESKEYERYEIVNLLAGHPVRKTAVVELRNKYNELVRHYFAMKLAVKEAAENTNELNNMINEQLLQQQLDTVSAALYDMCMYQYGALYQPLLDKYKNTRIHSDLLAQIIYDFMADPEETNRGYKNDGNLNHFLNGIRYSVFDYAERRLTEKAKDGTIPLAWKPTARNIEKVVFPLDKVNNSVADIAALGAAGASVLVGSVKKKDITVDVTITTDKEEDRRIITEKHSYAREVLKYASNLWDSTGYKTFNASDVYKVMHPEYEGKTVPPEAEKEIERILLAWSRTMIVLDATTQGENWHPVFEWGDDSDPNEDATIKRVSRARIALPVSVVEMEVKRNGKVYPETVFMFNSSGHPEQPILWEYAHKTRQILTVPPQLLITPTVSHSRDTVSLRDYMLRELLKTQHRNNTYLYDTIAKETGIPLMDSNHMRSFRKNLTGILDDLIAKGIIISYEESKIGKRYSKVTIIKADQEPGKKKAAKK